MSSLTRKAQQIAGRIVALFVTSALAMITGSSVINATTNSNITVLQSAALAGFSAIAQVVERLARASMDGNLTWAEIDEAFSSPANKKDKPE